jgi:hypothetical protein
MKVQFNDLDMGILEQMKRDENIRVTSDKKLKDMMKEAGTIDFHRMPNKVTFSISSHYYDLLVKEGLKI